MKNIVLNIDGMSCEHCVKAVSGVVGKFAGTQDIRVDLRAGTAAFAYDETQASLAEIKAAIADQGYEIKN